MSNLSIDPEDIIANGIDTIEYDGVVIRKGTMGAVLANIDLLNTGSAQAESDALAKIRELAPGLIKTGIQQHVVWKSTAVQAIFDELS